MTGEEPVSTPLHIDAERMRRLGYQVVDRVVRRWESLRELPAGGMAGRSEMENRLREPLPRKGVPVEELLERFWHDIEPFAGRIDHPRFFAFIPSSPTFAGLLGDWLASGCNFFQGTWIESAGPSETELVVIDWLREALGLPEETEGLLTSGGSAANLLGLAVAREEKLDGVPADGVAYGSDQTHTAVDRAMRILGFPADRLRRLPSGADGRLEPGAVAEACDRDRAAGLRPFCVTANAGTTNSGAVDPLDALADVCEEKDLWLHVDGAYGAFGRLTARGAVLLEGLERADSLVLDPHKWLYVGYEAGCLLVRRGELLGRTFHVLPDYLRDTETRAGEVNFADRGLQLTRAARALKLWFAIKAHGMETLAAAIDRTQDLAEAAERLVRCEPDLEVAAPASLGIVCFRYVGDPPLADEAADRTNEEALRRVQRAGRFMLSSTRLSGRLVVRLCPLNYRSTETDVAEAIAAVAATARGVASERGSGGD